MWQRRLSRLFEKGIVILSTATSSHFVCFSACLSLISSNCLTKEFIGPCSPGAGLASYIECMQRLKKAVQFFNKNNPDSPEMSQAVSFLWHCFPDQICSKISQKFLTLQYTVQTFSGKIWLLVAQMFCHDIYAFWFACSHFGCRQHCMKLEKTLLNVSSKTR